MPSPQGRFLSCIDPDTGDLAIRDLASGKLRRLTHRAPGSKEFAYFSAVSPDSRHIAYAWFNESGFYDLRVAAVETGESRVLYRNEESGFVQPSDWTPDGRHILTLFFRKDNISQIALVPADGGAVRVLKSLPWVYPKKMDISPGGRWIVYDSFAAGSQSQRDIYILAMDGSRESTLVASPAEDVFPLWTPDGENVLFSSNRLGTSDVWMVAVKDGKPAGAPRVIKRGLERFLPMGITADGTLYFAQRSGARDVFTVSVEGGAPEKLASRFPGANSSPAWSPDGERIAYLTRQGAENFGTEARVITIRSIKSGVERQIAPKLAHMEQLRWSPDGKWFLISGSDGKGRSGIFLAGADSDTVRPVVWDQEATFRGVPADWLDSDRLILGGPQLRERNRTSGEERIVDPQPASAIAVSSEKRIAFISTNEVIELGKGAVYKGEATAIAWAGAELVIATPEGFVVSGRKIALREYDQGSISVHPGGKRIAFSGGRVRNEIWAMKLP